MKGESQSTLIAARVLGPTLLAAAGVMLFNNARLLAMVSVIVTDNPIWDGVSILAGFLSLMFGLVILSFHRTWSSPTQFLVSLLGVAGLLRGLALLFLPEIVRGIAQHLASWPSALPIAGAVVAVIGLWLAFVGWFGKAAA